MNRTTLISFQSKESMIERFRYFRIQGNPFRSKHSSPVRDLAFDLIVDCFQDLGRGIESGLGKGIQNCIRSKIVVL